jgi:TPR repeat protein
MPIAGNDAMSTYWMRKSAEQGHHKAQGNLGASYEFGLNGLPMKKMAALVSKVGRTGK